MYYSQNRTMRNRNNEQQMNSYIRVLHASPDAPPVDIYVNDSMLLDDLAYLEISPYLSVEAGNYNIKVYPAGEITDPVIDTNVSIPENSVFTVAAIGTLADLELYPIAEPSDGQRSGQACVRFIHLSPNAPNVDINLEDGTTVFANVGYQEVSDYFCVPSGAYGFTVNLADTDDVVLELPNVEFESDMFYSIYAVGFVGEEPELEAILFSEERY